MLSSLFLFLVSQVIQHIMDWYQPGAIVLQVGLIRKSQHSFQTKADFNALTFSAALIPSLATNSDRSTLACRGTEPA
jgi:hypothetical protein